MQVQRSRRPRQHSPASPIPTPSQPAHAPFRAPAAVIDGWYRPATRSHRGAASAAIRRYHHHHRHRPRSRLRRHAASRRRIAACDPSPITPARTRAWLALPRAAAQPTAQGRCIGEAAMQMRLPPRRSRPLAVAGCRASPLDTCRAQAAFSGCRIAGGAREALTALLSAAFLHIQARDVKSHTCTRAGIRSPACCRRAWPAL